MERSSSLQANSRLASQEIPRLFWNLKVQYRAQKPRQTRSTVSHFV
jgi:hypothetical protein